MFSQSRPHPFSSSLSRTGGQFPALRLRRLRAAGWIRDLAAEHHVTAADLIWPVFVTDGGAGREAIAAMPGAARLGIEALVEDLRRAGDLGIRACALFPVTPPSLKTTDGREALNPANLICRAVQAVKQAVPHMGVITDVALDPYTTHGHDGIFENNEILNDETVHILAQQAVIQAQAGADVIAPSDMMDGRVGAIRAALDTAGFSRVLILSYAAKYASCFYGPFRDAVGSAGFLKSDKKTYQMNPANANEALREVALDIQEGADMVMVKPGLPYLDVIARVKETFRVPTFAYQVSGEYAMLRAAAAQGWLDYEAGLAESLLCLKRAGCDGIFTYGACDMAKILAQKSS